jgi:hypothetical protein
MPIVAVPAEVALATIEGNDASGWTSPEETFGAARRAKPKARPSFQLTRDDKVFTVGSCFSRNIEKALAARGFQVPTLQSMRSNPEFAIIGPHVLNNFSIASILNEMRWAFEIEIFDEKANFIEVVPGYFVDLHLNSGIPPEPYETVALRRRAISSVYRKLSECRVHFIILSDVEVWFDKRTNLYLNTAPSQTVIAQFHDRFEFHVLDRIEVERLLGNMLDLVRLRGPLDHRIIFTISPIPIPRTYRPLDVIVANFYSKSVLRTAIEHVITGNDHIDYFPCLEIVFHSDDASIWQEDGVHLKLDVIDEYAARLLTTYAPVEEPPDGIVALLDEGGDRDPGHVFGTLEGRRELMVRRPELAIRFAGAAVKLRRFKEARTALELLPKDFAADERLWIDAQALFGEGKYIEVDELLSPRTKEWGRRNFFWVMLVTSRFRSGAHESGKKALRAWTTAFPRSAEPWRTGASLVAQTDDLHFTRYLFNKARMLARTEDAKTRVALDYAEHLAALGRIALARKALEEARPVNPSQAARLSELKLRTTMSRRAT